MGPVQVSADFGAAGTKSGDAKSASATPPSKAALATEGVSAMSYSGARRDVATLVFKRYNTSHSGIFEDLEWKKLCDEMVHAPQGPEPRSLPLRPLLNDPRSSPLW